MLLVLVASENCRDAPLVPAVVVPDSPDRIIVAAGDGQEGPTAAVLPDFVQFEVLDAAGQPVSGADVTITVLAGGGSVDANRGVTDANGVIAVAWTLGGAGAQQLEVRAGAATAQSHATACTDNCAGSAPLDQIVPVALETYDGSGQAVHPDVTDAPGIGTGRWLAITPYPFGRRPASRIRRSSIALAAAGTMPDGAVNPVAEPAMMHTCPIPTSCSTPPDEQLWLYYRARG